MKQMIVDADRVVSIDYEDKNLHPMIRELQPVVYKDDDAYCCLLGPDPGSGIFGCGVTAEEAQTDWVNTLQQRLQDKNSDNDLLEEIRDKLSLTKDDVW